MTTRLQKLVSALPEIYQTIYEHEEWDSEASRNCNERMAIINQHYESLEKALGRPLRVLDLGCAQGFFSLSLASRGAQVKGIDFLQENINVCQALAAEHADFNVTFAVGKIEEVIEQLKPDQYDLAIGLSVFHHLVYMHGAEQVKTWLTQLAECTQAMILELALKEEPLYWGSAQPKDPRELFAGCAFYKQIAEFPTHLSELARPMYVVSNQRIILSNFNKPFNSWSTKPYPHANYAHAGRRYYFADDFVCKLYQLDSSHDQFAPDYYKRYLMEIQNELSFLTNPTPEFHAPALLVHGSDNSANWVVMEGLAGKLLHEKINQGDSLDAELILTRLLEQLVILEQAGLYHDDLRTWNIMVSAEQKISLIDYGSISKEQADCTWPTNIFQSFFILVHDLLTPEKIYPGVLRNTSLSPFALPAPYSNWLYALWQKPVSKWSFALLHELFITKMTLPEPATHLSGTEQWIAAQEQALILGQAKILALETALQESRVAEQNLQRAITELNTQFGARIAALEQKYTKRQSVSIRTHEQQMPANTPPPYQATASLPWLLVKLRRPATMFLAHAARYIKRRPKLKSAVLFILNRIPGIKLRIYHLGGLNK